MDRVEHRGDEVALDGECTLDALTGAYDAILLVGLVVELEARDDLAGQNFQRAAVLAREHVRLGRAHGKRAQHRAVGRKDGRGSIGAAIGRRSERHA
jgi:hypothetical protein